MLKNEQGRGFKDVTENSGFLTVRVRGATNSLAVGRASQVAVFADIDNDGDLDAFSGSPVNSPKGVTGELRPEIWLNDGKGVFTTLSQYPLGAVTPNPGGATFFDYDLDGLADLFIPAAKTQGGSGGWLFKGTGKPSAPFERAPFTFPGAAPYVQSSVACDLNNDRRQELLIAAIAGGPNALWQANGDTSFADHGIDSKYAFDEAADPAWKDNLSAGALCSYVRENRRVPLGMFTSQQCQALPAGCPRECTSRLNESCPQAGSRRNR